MIAPRTCCQRFASALTVAGLALTLPLLAGCGAKEAPPAAPDPVPVTVAEVVARPMPVTIEAIGTVVAPQTVEVRSRVGGELVGVHFREGDDVQQGQPLFTIDRRPLEAALAEARAQLARDRALEHKAEQDVKRYADLVAKDFVTKEQYDQAKASAESLQATVTADEAVAHDAEVQLSYTTMSAPISGRTGSVLVHRGNLVKANDQPLVVIHQVAPIDVTFEVPQQSLNEVRRRAAGGTLDVVAVPPDAGTPPQHGRLVFIDNAVDSDTGTIQLKASFPNAVRELWPGQFVNVSLRLGTENGAIVAPSPAVQSGQEGDFVFVVKADHTVESRPVKVARTVDGEAVIAQGLAAGETVVTDGQLRLTAGMPITVKQPGGGAAAAATPPAALPAAQG